MRNQEVVEKFFSKVLKISRIFRFGGHWILKNDTLSIGCYPNINHYVFVADLKSVIFQEEKVAS